MRTDELDIVRRAQGLSTLYMRSGDIAPALTEFVELAIAVSEADFGTVQILDRQSGALKLVAQHGFPDWWLELWETVTAGQGACGTALERGERIVVEDIEQDPIFIDSPALEVQLRAGVRAVQSSPLISWKGDAVGVLSTHYRMPHHPGDHELRLLDVLARQAAGLISFSETEQALEESEERFRVFASATSDVVYRMGPDWREMRYLQGKEFIPDTESPTTSWLEKYIPPDDQPHVVAVINEAIRTKSIFDLAHRVLRVDGALGWTHSRAIPLLDAQGEILEWVGAASDITERKQSDEEAVAASEKRYRELVETTNSVILRWDRQGTILFVNERGANLLGYDAAELIGRSVTTILPEVETTGRDLASMVQSILAHPEQHVSNLNENVRKDGTRIWIAWTNRAITDEEGTVREILAIGNDITPLKETEQALRESEKRFHRLFRDDLTGDYVSTREGQILLCNPAFAAIFGFSSAQEAVGSNMLEFFIDAAERDSLLETLEEHGNLANYQVWRKRRDGTPIHIVENLVGRFNDQGELYEIQGYIFDDTERKHAEEELSRSNRDLNEFASVVSHDLREPLRQILAFAELLQQRYGDRLDDRGREFLKFIVDGGKRMHALIKDLLALSRVGRQGENKEKTPLEDMLDQALQNLQSKITETDADISSESLPTLDVVPPYIMQVFQNLIGNSLKYRSEKKPVIHIGCRREETEWLFWVSDNGIGFSRNEAERIFEPFQRLQPDSRYEGTGIGLSICKRVIELHGGRIWADSEPGKGSTFYFTLPAE